MVDKIEIWNIIRNIKDPEHPLTLEELEVVNIDFINILRNNNSSSINLIENYLYPKEILVEFKPTIPHCSMAAIIGLSIIYSLRDYTEEYNIRVKIIKDTHTNYKSINKQLEDRDRVYAAFENNSILCILKDLIPNK